MIMMIIMTTKVVFQSLLVWGVVADSIRHFSSKININAPLYYKTEASGRKNCYFYGFGRYSSPISICFGMKINVFFR
jgi:hypothetical protein